VITFGTPTFESQTLKTTNGVASTTKDTMTMILQRDIQNFYRTECPGKSHSADQCIVTPFETCEIRVRSVDKEKLDPCVCSETIGRGVFYFMKWIKALFGDLRRDLKVGVQ
jgi:hypothetical protein